MGCALGYAFVPIELYRRRLCVLVEILVEVLTKLNRARLSRAFTAARLKLRTSAA